MVVESKLKTLTCNLTGDKVSIYPDYYEKKIVQYGSEEKLHRLYISYKIITLLRRGYSLESISKSHGFELDDSKEDYYKELIDFYKNNNALIKTSNKDVKVSFLKTDPAVKDFIKRFQKIVN